MANRTNDPVNKPSHYTDGKIEVLDFIEDKKLGFHLGNVVKYVCRAGKKDPAKTVEDLKKARFYLDRKIKELEEAEMDSIKEEMIANFLHDTNTFARKWTTLLPGSHESARTTPNARY